jgi:hypothetical protein
MERLRSHPFYVLLGAASGALALAAAVATAGALAAAPVISLSLGAGKGQRQLSCAVGGKADPYRVFPRAARIVIAGSVKPKPAIRLWRVTVTVRRCTGGRFHTSWERVLTGRPDGSFRVVYTARSRGLYFVRAEYRRKPPIETGKHRFVVS